MPPGRTTHPYDIAQLGAVIQQIDRNLVRLTIKEQPARGKACRSHRKARGPRWPIEPPPVIELSLATMAPKDMSSIIINSPNYFCTAELKPIKGRMSSDELIEGNTVASLTRVKINNTEHGLFVFNDIHVKDAGDYSLVFTMFEMRPHHNNTFAEKVASIESNIFKIYENNKQLGPPVRPSTFISALMESGVRIKIRKDAPRRKKMQQDWSSSISTAGLPPNTAFPHRIGIHGHGVSTSNPGEDISSRLRQNPIHTQFMPAIGQVSPQANYQFHAPMLTQAGTIPSTIIPSNVINPYPLMGHQGHIGYNIPYPAMQMNDVPTRVAYPMLRSSEHLDPYVQPQVSNAEMQSMYDNQWSGNPRNESFPNQMSPGSMPPGPIQSGLMQSGSMQSDSMPAGSTPSGYPGYRAQYQGYGSNISYDTEDTSTS